MKSESFRGENISRQRLLLHEVRPLCVPSISIVNAPSGMFVLKVQNDTIQRVAVKQGLRKDLYSSPYSCNHSSARSCYRSKSGIFAT